MRQGPHQKRGRGRGGNRRSNNTPNRNQTFESNGPDVRIRGNATQVYEKYLNLARDASTSGDRVLAESYYQHAEHYYRFLSAFNDDNQNRDRSQNGQQQGNGRGDYGDDDEDDSGNRQPNGRNGGDRRQEARDDDRPRGENGQAEAGRGETGRNDAGRSENGRNENGRNDNDRSEGGRGGNGRGGNGRGESSRGDGNRADQQPRGDHAESEQGSLLPGEGDQPAVAAAPVNDDTESEAPAPRRRGRPRKTERPAEEARDGAGPDEGIRRTLGLGGGAAGGGSGDGDAAGEAEAEAPKPRRTRRRKAEPAEEGTTEQGSTGEDRVAAPVDDDGAAAAG